MIVLAFDTTTEACSVALQVGEKIYTRDELQPRQQAKLILPLIESILREAAITRADLDCLAVTIGPGSFTGVRLGVSVAQGLAYALNLSVIGVSTLAVLAQQAKREYGATRVLSALDARMAEVYFGVYEHEKGQWRTVLPEVVVPPAQVCFPEGNNWVGIGHGWGISALLEASGERIIAHHEDCHPSAVDILPLAAQQIEVSGGVQASELVPVYLRNNVTN